MKGLSDDESLSEVEEEIYQDIIHTVQKSLQVEEYETNEENVLKEWGILLTFALLYAVIGMAALAFVDRDQR